MLEIHCRQNPFLSPHKWFLCDVTVKLTPNLDGIFNSNIKLVLLYRPETMRMAKTSTREMHKFLEDETHERQKLKHLENKT